MPLISFHIEAVTRAREIQYHPFLSAFDARDEDRRFRCCHHCGKCCTSHNLENGAASHVLGFHKYDVSDSGCKITDNPRHLRYTDFGDYYHFYGKLNNQ